MSYVKEQPSYFKIMYGRGLIKWFFLQFIYTICTPFRLILEVFIRRRMGERYFSGFVCLFWSILFIGGSVFSFTNQAKFVVPEPYLSNLNAVGIFGILFFAFSIWRWVESYQSPSKVSFDKFSKSSGDLTLLFKMLQHKNVSTRLIEIWLEPLLFFLIGGVLLVIPETRYLGLFIVGCSIFYSLSYRASYALARDYILDIIDEKISTTEVGQFVKTGLGHEEENHFRSRSPYATKESEKELLSQLILNADPTGEVSSVAQ